jgi:DNA-binding response OmpR family regulator
LELNETIDISILVADEYIQKPFDINELLTTIKRLLGENPEFRGKVS